MRLVVGRGHEHGYVLACYFGLGVAEHALGGRVKSFDCAAFVDGDDAVHGSVENSPQACFAFAQRLFGLLAARDVVYCRHHQQPLPGFKRGKAHVHGELAAVPAQAEELHSCAHGARMGLGKIIRKIEVVPLPEAFRKQDFHRFSDQLLARVAEELLDDGIGKDDPSFPVDDDHRIGGGFQKPLKAFSFEEMFCHGWPLPVGFRIVVLWLKHNTARAKHDPLTLFV